MGNSASKKARQEQLDAAEKQCAAAAETIASRDRELANKEKELRARKVEGTNAASEASTLKQKVEELDALCKALEQEQKRQFARLQAELKQKGDEALAQRRITDSRAQERDEARRLLKDTEGKVKDLEHSNQADRETSEQRHMNSEAAWKSTLAELKSVLLEKEESLETVQSELDHSRKHVQQLEQHNRDLNAELSSSKTTAAEELSSALAAAAQETSAAQALAAEEAHNRAEVDRQLQSMKEALMTSEAKRDVLQRTHNESVSRRAASHEAFTATKLELAEAQQKYHTLYQEHEKQRRDLDENLSTAKKYVGEAQARHEQLQAEHDSLTVSKKASDDELARVKEELSVTRREMEEKAAGYDVELAALRRKPGLEVNVQELSDTSD